MEQAQVYEHIKFSSWVGPRYEHQSDCRCHLMVLGESHYEADLPVARGDFTNEVVSRIVKREDKGYRTRLFVKTSRLILQAMGKDPKKEDWRELWNSLLFYNFVQTILPDVRHRPTEDDWRTGETALPCVLEVHKPDLVLVLGIELAKRAKPIIVRSHPRILPVVIKHPSAFGWSYKEEWVTELTKAMRGKKEDVQIIA